MEDKQRICDELCSTLKLTRSNRDLQRIKYDPKTEIVTILWVGGTRSVNVAMDSGTAMIRDIMRVID